MVWFLSFTGINESEADDSVDHVSKIASQAATIHKLASGTSRVTVSLAYFRCERTKMDLSRLQNAGHRSSK